MKIIIIIMVVLEMVLKFLINLL